MTASKENAALALDMLAKEGGTLEPGVRRMLTEFLEAALRKLPTQAAIDRDKQRQNRRSRAPLYAH